MGLRKALRGLTVGVLGVGLLGHVLFVVSLVGFRVLGDGWVLHPVGVAWYALWVLGGCAALIAAVGRRGLREALPAGLLVLPVLLTLALLGAFPIAGTVAGARYAPWDTGDLHEGVVALSLAAALVGAGLALFTRRPRLLWAWMGSLAALVVSYPAWWARLWRWGTPGGSPLATLLLVAGLPALTAVSARALGQRLPARWARAMAVGLGVGIGLGLLAWVRWGGYLMSQAGGAAVLAEMRTAFAITTAPLLGAFGALLLPLPWLAWRALREDDSEALRYHRGRPFPWAALALLVLGATSLSLSYVQVQPEGMLPAAGSVQGWHDDGRVVPDAWVLLDVVVWLLRAVRWLLLPYALLNLVALASAPAVSGTARRQATRLGLAFPGILVTAGIACAVALVWTTSPLGMPRRLAMGPPATSLGAVVVLGTLGLLAAGRALERVGRATWGDWTWRWVAGAGLVAVLLWAGEGAWITGRLLVAPLPAWISGPQWASAPLGRVPLSALGLLVYLALCALGLVAAVRWGREAGTALRQGGRLASAAAPALVLAALVGAGWWLTAPRVVQSTPSHGATGVPRETTISVTMHPRVRLADWLGMSGMGMQVRYADTGETIQGMTGGSASGMRFDPDGLLRPGAPVEVEVRRAGERAYRLAFITETDGSSRASSAGE